MNQIKNNFNTKQNIVIDTNILISAILSPHSVTYQMVKQAFLYYEICFSQETLDEFLEVINRPKFTKYFANRLNEKEEFISDLLNLSVMISVTHQVNDCQDPKDNKFLSLALSANAIYLITGDKRDLLSMNPYQGIEIITVNDFINKKTPSNH